MKFLTATRDRALILALVLPLTMTSKARGQAAAEYRTRRDPINGLNKRCERRMA